MEFWHKLTASIVAGVMSWMMGNTTPAVLSKNTSQSSLNRDNFVWFLVDNLDRLELILNYEQKMSFREIVVNNNCEKAINGGFYDTENNPLGLIVVNNVKKSEDRPSMLFNGYISVGDDNKILIGREPVTKIKYGVQSGPILVEKGKSLSLDIKNDSASRRSVAITTDDGQLLFGTFYDPDSPLDGPKLSELPALVLQQAGKMDVGIESAINLDGGSASAFYDGGFAISEWAPVGSIWCLK